MKKMKKEALLRGLLGVPIGMAIGQVVSIASSLSWGGGQYLPATPQLIEACGGLLGAVVVQTILCGLIGAGFAAGSVVWEVEAWSLARQTACNYLISLVVMLPAAYINHWMAHSVAGVLVYFLIFTVIFAVIWLVMYLRMRRSVRAMNDKLGR